MNQSYERSSGQRETTWRAGRLAWRGGQREKKTRKTPETRSKSNEMFVSGCEGKTPKRWRQRLTQICVRINWHGEGIPSLFGALKTSAHTEEQHQDIGQVTAGHEGLVERLSSLERANSAGKGSQILVLFRQHQAELHIKKATSSVGKQ